MAAIATTMTSEKGRHVNNNESDDDAASPLVLSPLVMATATPKLSTEADTAVRAMHENQKEGSDCLPKKEALSKASPSATNSASDDDDPTPSFPLGSLAVSSATTPECEARPGMRKSEQSSEEQRLHVWSTPSMAEEISKVDFGVPPTSVPSSKDDTEEGNRDGEELYRCSRTTSAALVLTGLFASVTRRAQSDGHKTSFSNGGAGAGMATSSGEVRVMEGFSGTSQQLGKDSPNRPSSAPAKLASTAMSPLPFPSPFGRKESKTPIGDPSPPQPTPILSPQQDRRVDSAFPLGGGGELFSPNSLPFNNSHFSTSPPALLEYSAETSPAPVDGSKGLLSRLEESCVSNPSASSCDNSLLPPTNPKEGIGGATAQESGSSRSSLFRDAIASKQRKPGSTVDTKHDQSSCGGIVGTASPIVNATDTPTRHTTTEEQKTTTEPTNNAPDDGDEDEDGTHALVSQESLSWGSSFSDPPTKPSMRTGELSREEETSSRGIHSMPPSSGHVYNSPRGRAGSGPGGDGTMYQYGYHRNREGYGYYPYGHMPPSSHCPPPANPLAYHPLPHATAQLSLHPCSSHHCCCCAMHQQVQQVSRGGGQCHALHDGKGHAYNSTSAPPTESTTSGAVASTHMSAGHPVNNAAACFASPLYHHRYMPPPPPSTTPFSPIIPMNGSGTSSLIAPYTAAISQNRQGKAKTRTPRKQKREQRQNDASYSPGVVGGGSFVTPPPKKKQKASSSSTANGSGAATFSSIGPSAFPTKTATTAGSETNNDHPTKSKVLYDRKEKSLGLLCERFIATYNTTNNKRRRGCCISKDKENAPHPTVISIDETASILGVERRRIYDIVNVLEAVHIVTRQKKNTYLWHGMDDLPDFFGELQCEAMKFWRNDAISNGLIATTGGGDSASKDKDSLGLSTSEEDGQDGAADGNLNGASGGGGNGGSRNGKKATERSLGKLTRKFLQLFLVGYDVISLQYASDKILGPSPSTTTDVTTTTKADNDDDDDGGGGASKTDRAPKVNVGKESTRGFKTKVRRLYDIANVMVSIGVIAKVGSSTGGKGGGGNLRAKPSFAWSYRLNPKDLSRLKPKELSRGLVSSLKRKQNSQNGGGRGFGSVTTEGGCEGSGGQQQPPRRKSQPAAVTAKERPPIAAENGSGGDAIIGTRNHPHRPNNSMGLASAGVPITPIQPKALTRNKHDVKHVLPVAPKVLNQEEDNDDSSPISSSPLVTTDGTKPVPAMEGKEEPC